jgi:hypothetical protein
MKALELALTLSLLAAAPALAQPTVATKVEPKVPITFSIDAETRWRLDRGYRVLGTDRADSVGGVSLSVQVRRLAGGMLEVGAGYHTNTSSGTWAGENLIKLEERTPSLSALLRWSPRRWLEPHVRLAADVTQAKLRLTLPARALEDELWSPGGSAGAGLRLRTPALTTGLAGGKLGIAAALIIEGGFRVGAPLSFDVAPPAPADQKVADDLTPASRTSLGDLGRAQPYLRLSFALLI